MSNVIVYKIVYNTQNYRLQFLGFPSRANSKASTCTAGDLGLTPGLERSPEEENGNPLQYSCLENSMESGAWWAAVHGAAKSWT